MADMLTTPNVITPPDFKRGDAIASTDPLFASALKAAIDYRGDCRLELTNGHCIEGYLYNLRTSGTSPITSTSKSELVDLFPHDSPRAETVKIAEIQRLVFSGEDTASGKSWDDWQKKKAAESKSS